MRGVEHPPAIDAGASKREAAVRFTEMMTMRTNLRIVAATLLGVGLIGFLFASPEPVRIVALPDGSATAVPRIPWAAALSQLAFVIGFGILIVTYCMKKGMKREPNNSSGI